MADAAARVGEDDIRLFEASGTPGSSSSRVTPRSVVSPVGFQVTKYDDAFDATARASITAMVVATLLGDILTDLILSSRGEIEPMPTGGRVTPPKRHGG